ncbi:MAG: hypothetical protein F6K44_32595 [Moorea sp. SIO3E2]|nr:hypothetical protein [Moorena sp. SIO3E2]
MGYGQPKAIDLRSIAFSACLAVGHATGTHIHPKIQQCSLWQVISSLIPS